MYLVVDCETTHLDPNVSAVIQLGMVMLDKDFNETQATEFRVMAHPGATIDPRAMEVNKLEGDPFETGLMRSEARREIGVFMQYAHRPVFVAHGAAFDLAHLRESLMPGSWSSDVFRGVICTKGLAKFLGLPTSLDKLAAEFNIIPPAGDRHTALYDARLTARVLRAMHAARVRQ